MNINEYLSVLDTKRFGINIAKVDNFENSPESIIEFLKANDVKLILSKIPIENIELINKLESLRFVTKDIQTTYRFDLKNLKSVDNITEENIIIREFISEDIPFLQKIAAESFKDYGHYAKDDRLDKDKCNEIYIDWITRSCQDRNVADKIFVAKYKGVIAGFLSFKLYTKDNYRYAAGGLGAVSNEYRRFNIFRAITKEGLIWGKEIDLDWEEHNVLVNNYPVNKSFIKSGFYTYRSFITMHHWIE